MQQLQEARQGDQAPAAAPPNTKRDVDARLKAYEDKEALKVGSCLGLRLCLGSEFVSWF